MAKDASNVTPYKGHYIEKTDKGYFTTKSIKGKVFPTIELAKKELDRMTKDLKVNDMYPAEVFKMQNEVANRKGIDKKYLRITRISNDEYEYSNTLGDTLAIYDNKTKKLKMFDSKTKDDRSVKIFGKRNGYVLGLNDKGTIYLAFPGETANNPHMYLGKETQENLENAKKVFERFARIGDKVKDSNFTVAVLNNLELAKKAEVKVLANKNLSRAKEIIEEHKGKGYLPGEVKRMEERLAQVTNFIDGKFKTKDAEKQLKSFEVKIGPKPGLPTAIVPFEKIIIKASSKSDAKKRWEETNTSGGTKVYEVKEIMVKDNNSKTKDDNKSEVKALAEKAMLRYSSGLKIKRWYSHDTTVVATIDVSKMVGSFDERHFTKALERAKIPGVKTIYMDDTDVVFELKYKVGDAIPSNLKKDKYVATKAKADAEMNRMIGSRDQFKIEREGVAGFVYKFRANGKIAGYYNDMSGDLYYDPKVMAFDSKPKVKDSKTAILTKVYDSLTNMESIIKDKK